jgi:hypothetical protein
LTTLISIFAPFKDDKKINELLQLCLPLVEYSTESLKENSERSKKPTIKSISHKNLKKPFTYKEL